MLTTLIIAAVAQFLRRRRETREPARVDVEVVRA
jgi:hypothetical protein